MIRNIIGEGHLSFSFNLWNLQQFLVFLLGLFWSSLLELASIRRLAHQLSSLAIRLRIMKIKIWSVCLALKCPLNGEKPLG